MSLLFTSIASLLLVLGSALSPATPIPAPEQQPASIAQQQTDIKGSWKLTSGTAPFAMLPANATAIVTMEDGYFSVVYFSLADKKFIGTYGGTFSAANGTFSNTLEFNTLEPSTVGNYSSLVYTITDKQLEIKSTEPGYSFEQVWTKVEEPKTASPLEGTWRITGRVEQDGKLATMQRGPRKTLKILSGSRFQWIAFNTDTREFSGTGGGTYTAQNGKYTENIEFFSRDSSRVGASLTFKYEVKDGKWHHSGKSSTGNPIHEVWEREQQ